MTFTNDSTEIFSSYLEGKRLKVTMTQRNDYSGRASRTKVYVSVPTPEEFGQTDGHPAYTRKGDDPVADAGWKAYNKLEAANMRHFAEAAVVGKLGFSRKAGCSCGCSPGFNIQDGSLGYATSVFVTAEFN